MQGTLPLRQGSSIARGRLPGSHTSPSSCASCARKPRLGHVFNRHKLYYTARLWPCWSVCLSASLVPTWLSVCPSICITRVREGGKTYVHVKAKQMVTRVTEHGRAYVHRVNRQCSIAQYNTRRCSTIQYKSAARHKATKHNKTRHDTTRHSTTWCKSSRCDTAQNGTARHGTARHGTARHGTARHGTARHWCKDLRGWNEDISHASSNFAIAKTTYM